LQSHTTLSTPSRRHSPAWRETAETAAPPSQGWWTGFNSTELNTLMQQADAQNFDLAAAIVRVEEANAQARISGAALLPSVQANGQVGQAPPQRPCLSRSANSPQMEKPNSARPVT
jgi:outer membrane protein TolC